MKHPAYILSTLVACIIFFLCIIQLPDETPPAFQIPYFDKIVHVLMYLGLAGTLLVEHIRKHYHYSWKEMRFFFMRKDTSRNAKINPISWQSLFILFLIPLLYGGLIEIIQEYFVSSRAGDVVDFLADLVGIIMAFAILRLAFWRKITSA